MNTKENKPTVNGALFQRQQKESAAPAAPPVEDVQQGQSDVPVVEETTGGSMPVPVETASGKTAHFESAADEFPYQQNFEVAGGGEAIFENIKIQKDFQKYFVEKDDESYAKFNALIVGLSQPKAFWYPKDHLENPNRGKEMKFPFCHSFDGIRPVHDRVSENGCGENVCKYDCYGSIQEIKPDDTGNGKACKNMIAFIVIPLGFAKKITDEIPPCTREDILKILNNESDVYKVIGSPMSIKPGKKYITYTLGKRHKIFMAMAITEFRLKKVEDPHVYSVMELAYRGNIIPIIDDIKKNVDGGAEMVAQFKKSILDTQKYLNGHIVYEYNDVMPEDGTEPF